MKLTIMSVLLFAGLAISSLSHAEDESVRLRAAKTVLDSLQDYDSRLPKLETTTRTVVERTTKSTQDS